MVDVLKYPEARQVLQRLGARSVPVIVQGDRFVAGQNLREVAAFVGAQVSGHQPLPPPELVERWVIAMRTAQRLVAQFSPDSLMERVIPERSRTVRVLGHHVYRIGEAFLQTVISQVVFSLQDLEMALDEPGFTTAAEINAYGESVIAQLQRWKCRLEDGAGTQQLPTNYGAQTMHDLLERSVWHSAQHVRQLAYVLERSGKTPDGPLTAHDLAGLPMPERLFE